MPERVTAAKPRVEHPVRKNKIRRRCRTRRTPHSEVVKLPEAVRNHRIEFRHRAPEPRDRLRRETVIAAPRRARSQRVQRKRKVPDTGRVARIKRDNFDTMPRLAMRCAELPDDFDGTAAGWIDGVDDVENVHPAASASR